MIDAAPSIQMATVEAPDAVRHVPPVSLDPVSMTTAPVLPPKKPSEDDDETASVASISSLSSLSASLDRLQPSVDALFAPLHANPTFETVWTQPAFAYFRKELARRFLKGYLLGLAFDMLPKFIGVLIRTFLKRRLSMLGHISGILGNSRNHRLGWTMGSFAAGSAALEALFSKLLRLKAKISPASSTETLVAEEDLMVPSVESSCKEVQSVAVNAPTKPLKKRYMSTVIEYLPTFLSGAIAGGASLLILPSESRLDLAIAALVRAGDAFLAHVLSHHPNFVNSIPSFIRNNMDTVVFVGSCTEIMKSWFYTPASLPKGYTGWIFGMAQLDPEFHSFLDMLAKVKQGKIVYGKDTGYPDIMAGWTAKWGLPQECGDPGRGFVTCDVMHPRWGGAGLGCVGMSWERFYKGFPKALKIYLLVHSLPVILFRRYTLTNPSTAPKTVFHILFAAARSSTFLASFISIILAAICTSRNLTHNDLIGPTLGSALCGLSLLIERKSRRPEMALYVAPRAVYSWWWRWKHVKGRKGVPFGECVVFGAAMGALLTAVRREPETIRPTVRTVLKWYLK
ncbi:hypothetical protein HK104_007095 [Borealophlyctis nickersoniae]|nr:hypothetical protein HK104_007095 [Borealophlyctis nickersoniae]